MAAKAACSLAKENQRGAQQHQQLAISAPRNGAWWVATYRRVAVSWRRERNTGGGEKQYQRRLYQRKPQAVFRKKNINSLRKSCYVDVAALGGKKAESWRRKSGEIKTKINSVGVKMAKKI
jgi:hypothetical protein